MWNSKIDKTRILSKNDGVYKEGLKGKGKESYSWKTAWTKVNSYSNAHFLRLKIKSLSHKIIYS